MSARAIIPAMFLVGFTGCAEQITYGVGQTRATIPEMIENQALSNAAKAFEHPYNIPAQFTLKESLTSAVNTLNSGVYPDIALRMIAITGFNLSSSNALTQNWSADPVTGYLDVRRLQLLYDFAVNHHYPEKTFDELEREIYSLAPENQSNTTKTTVEMDLKDGGATIAKRTVETTTTRPAPFVPLSKVLGRLPDGPFMTVDTGCRSGLAKPVSSGRFGAVVQTDTVCILAGQRRLADGASEILKPRDLLALFVLWSYAIPQLSASAAAGPPQQGASPTSTRLIATPPALIQ